MGMLRHAVAGSSVTRCLHTLCPSLSLSPTGGWSAPVWGCTLRRSWYSVPSRVRHPSLGRRSLSLLLAAFAKWSTVACHGGLASDHLLRGVSLRGATTLRCKSRPRCDCAGVSDKTGQGRPYCFGAPPRHGYESMPWLLRMLHVLPNTESLRSLTGPAGQSRLQLDSRRRTASSIGTAGGVLPPPSRVLPWHKVPFWWPSQVGPKKLEIGLPVRGCRRAAAWVAGRRT